MTEIPEGEPVRWLDDPGAAPGLRADLAHGAGATAVGVDYAASLAALRGAMAATGPVATVAAAKGVTATSATMVKVGVVAIALAGTAAWWLGRRAPEDKATVAAATDRVPARDDRLAPSVDGRDATREGTPTRAEDAPAVPSPAVVQPERPLSAPAIDAATDPVGDPGGDAVGDADGVKTPDDAEATSADRRTKRPVDADDRFLREAKLVATARKQLAEDPAAALASTRRHAREFPKGALVEESHAIEIRALAKLGKTDAAQRKASEFLARFPDGPHAAAVRRAIEP
jgi:hypothetical protein